MPRNHRECPPGPPAGQGRAEPRQGQHPDETEQADLRQKVALRDEDNSGHHHVEDRADPAGREPIGKRCRCPVLMAPSAPVRGDRVVDARVELEDPIQADHTHHLGHGTLDRGKFHVAAIFFHPGVDPKERPQPHA